MQKHFTMPTHFDCPTPMAGISLNGAAITGVMGSLLGRDKFEAANESGLRLAA